MGLVGRPKLLARELFSARETNLDKREVVPGERGSYATASTLGAGSGGGRGRWGESKHSTISLEDASLLAHPLSP